jgi:hypothetical protein
MGFKKLFYFLCIVLSSNVSIAQNITYSEVEKTDSRNLNFEILGRFSENILIYKNLNRSHKLSIYENTMAIKETIKLDFISDKTFNLDFIKYQDYFLMIWQYEKGNTTFCKAAKMNADGKIIGTAIHLDSTKMGFFANKVYYTTTWSEDKKKILIYKTQSKLESFLLVSKIYDENLALLDSTRRTIEYNNNKESFTDLQVSNDGTIVFCKLKENARQEYINTIEVNFKKINVFELANVEVPLDKQLVQEPVIKIDNLNGNFVLTSFSYKKNRGNVDGILSATFDSKKLSLLQSKINVFDDSLLAKLSGRPDWRTAYDNFFIKNVILKKDGGFILVKEEYTKQRRFGGNFDDRLNSPYGGSFGATTSDYYLYNRGYNGYYRPYVDNNTRDITYNYNDIIVSSITKDLKLEWSSVINKTTSDVETDNYLSFSNMNAGGEVHFLFLQKDNNRQILSDHALQASGTIVRNATLKSREAGYEFMPRLARQTGARQMVMPCVVRNNIAFAKIEF